MRTKSYFYNLSSKHCSSTGLLEKRNPSHNVIEVNCLFLFYFRRLNILLSNHQIRRPPMTSIRILKLESRIHCVYWICLSILSQSFRSSPFLLILLPTSTSLEPKIHVRMVSIAMDRRLQKKTLINTILSTFLASGNKKENKEAK